jgi:protein-glutamine gamma-glutamyltransferase
MLSTLRLLPRDSRDTLFLLAVIAWVILPQTANVPLWCAVAAGIALLWRGTLAVQTKPLPSKWLVIAALAVVVGATWLTHRTLIGKEAGVTLIVALLTLKTLELRAKRDAFVVFFLGFFTMLTNFFYSQSLLVAASMVVALMGLLTALIHSHRVVGQPPLKASLKTAGFLVLLGAPIMAVLFVLFPRLSPLWGMPGDAAAKSGISGFMSVGDVAKLALDESVALRIKWKLKPGQSLPTQSQMYFRGPVLSGFDGRTWKVSDSLLARRFPVPAELRFASNASATSIDYEVTMEPTRKPWLYVLEAAVEKPKLQGYELAMTQELQWLTSQPISDLIRYTATSNPEFRHGPRDNAVGMQAYLDLPPGFNPRTLQLAMDIRRDPRFAQARADVLVPEIMRRLRDGGYTYTLEPGVYGQHTADEFWFDRKQGFCEHIASSFVILMRALDIPARVVTGYQGGEANTVDGLWTVRQSDAHAWTEVWMPLQGWVRVDPTGAVSPSRVGSFERLLAPTNAVAQAVGAVVPLGLAKQIRLAWEAVNSQWNSWVLNYSQKRQLDLLKNLGFQSPSWEDLGKVLALVIALVGLLGAAYSYWERQHQDPWLRELGRARQLLAKAGLDSSASIAPRRLAQLALERFGEPARPLHDWLLSFEKARYSSAQPGALAQSLATLKRSFPRIRLSAS